MYEKNAGLDLNQNRRSINFFELELLPIKNSSRYGA